MSSTLFCTTSMGPSVGDPTAMYAPPLRYKREALAVHDKHARAHSDTRWTQLQADPDSSNTTHSGRRILRSGARTTLTGCVHLVLERDRTSH